MSFSPALVPTTPERGAFDLAVASSGQRLHGLSIDAVQVNIGLRCDLACRHCHVEASPKRREEMSWETMLAVLDAAQRARAGTLDITGGAPEMHSRFRDFVDQALVQNLRVMVRTNLTILLRRGYRTLPEWYARRKVHLVASLPCYLGENVDRQRGRHVHKRSIEAIQGLNQQGYGVEPRKILDLVYNPREPKLPPAQQGLENAYRRELLKGFGIRFSRLIVITNAPLGRFAQDLRRRGQREPYLQLLRDAFNPATIEGLMCRHQLHVGHDGMVYDCDFNFAAGLQVEGPVHVSRFEPRTHLARSIATGEHCFACTAGRGSSCGGMLV